MHNSTEMKIENTTCLTLSSILCQIFMFCRLSSLLPPLLKIQLKLFPFLFSHSTHPRSCLGMYTCLNLVFKVPMHAPVT